jgi:uncharacterized phage-associated protein
MIKQDQIKKTRATIQGMLALLKRKLGRTELVKLVYLADNRFYESMGRTITGNLYTWDRYGPNAVSHAIANEADELANLGAVRMVVRQSMYGSDVYQYWVDDPTRAWAAAASVLDEGERQILMDVARQYGQMSLRDLVKNSKETRPFKKAQQYDLLTLEQDENARQMSARLGSDGEFLEEVKLGLEDADRGRWVWDEELDS